MAIRHRCASTLSQSPPGEIRFGRYWTESLEAKCRIPRWTPLPSNHSRIPSIRSRVLGAVPISQQATLFRVWAPRRKQVDVQIYNGNQPSSRFTLHKDAAGYHAGIVPGATSGTQYMYLLDGDLARPDPASRYQPRGVHGPSQVIHPEAFAWTDATYTGVARGDLIIYELHIGAFTQEGTYRAAMDRIGQLMDLGVTAIELMPVAQTPGQWNWGYDGVFQFAPRNTYGHPDDFKALVDACHKAGIAVILDVVYNHLGPEGNYLSSFGPYFSRKHHTPWGDAFNFDGRPAAHVRQYIIDNAVYWLREFHLDGLRLDAVHFMHDDSRPHILEDIRTAVTQYAESAQREIHLIAESNIYDGDLLALQPRPYDAIWSDCLMHSLYSHALPRLQITHREYLGARDVADSLRHGYIYAGTTPTRATRTLREKLHRHAQDREYLTSLIVGLQTHDCVGNHPHGKRLHHLASKEYQRAALTLIMLYPGIPILFMGEEHATDSVFPFFADFEDPRLKQAVDEGRAKEYPQHMWDGALRPSQVEAFLAAKCHDAAQHDEQMFAWYRQLITFRKQALAAGWLSANHLQTGHDAQHHIFWLRYEPNTSSPVTIYARLSPVDDAPAEPVAIEGMTANQVLLTSQPISPGDNLLLATNHAIVCQG